MDKEKEEKLRNKYYSEHMNKHMNKKNKKTNKYFICFKNFLVQREGMIMFFVIMVLVASIGVVINNYKQEWREERVRMGADLVCLSEQLRADKNNENRELRGGLDKGDIYQECMYELTRSLRE